MYGQQGKTKNIPPLHFYEVMGYPTPINKNIFYYKQNTKEKNNGNAYKSKNKFSREKKSKYMDEYISFINKYDWLYKSLPFIEEIYLANSISFNALTENSDIDLFVITKSNRIRTSRLITSILFYILWIKRTSTKERKRFCLSFFIDENNKNLKKISIWDNDIYFFYRIAHLIPLYSNNWNFTIYQKNIRIKEYLPNITTWINISIWNKIVSNNSPLKASLEYIFWWKFWDLIEKWIEFIWKKKIGNKIKLNQEKHKDIIISRGIQKFYYDKRKIYADLFFS